MFTLCSLRRFFLASVCLSSLALCFSSPVYAQGHSPSIEEAGDSAVSEPDSSELTSADDAVGFSSDDSDGSGIAAPSAVLPGDGEDSFFDANDLVPQGEMTREGPNKVSPSLQPGSKFVIVKGIFKADSEKARMVSAERALSFGRYGSALELFDVLYLENKMNSRVLMGRAIAFQKLGRFDEAMGMYEALSKIEPNNIEAKTNMLGVLGTKYPSIALRRLIELHQKHRSNVALTAQLAFAYAKSGDSASALRYLGVVASMEPHNANHVFNMAVIADRMGDLKQAVAYYEQSLEIDTIHGGGRSIPRDSVYTRLAQIR